MTTQDEARAALFWAKVEKTDTCWIWTASKSEGYGRFWSGERQVPAHRWAYEALVGPIPEGHQLDHLCRNHPCVRPEHLEPVTNQENTRRGIAADIIYARQAAQTRCRNGHEFSEENTHWVYGTQRQCRACGRDRARRYHAKKVARRAGEEKAA